MELMSKMKDKYQNNNKMLIEMDQTNTQIVKNTEGGNDILKYVATSKNINSLRPNTPKFSVWMKLLL